MILSAPDERYVEHIKKALGAFDRIFPMYQSSLRRIFNISDNELESCLRDMIKYHDLGKLTERWQSRLEDKRLTGFIPHASIGAAYLWKKLGKIYNESSDLRHAVCFAVCIHHVDSGLIGENIERPDVQAVIANLVDQFTGEIIWCKEVVSLDSELFPEDVSKLNVSDLRDMANGLRIWSRGCGLHEQHRRRIMTAAVHHVLKLCDFLAASYRARDENNNQWQNIPYVRSMMRYLEKFKGGLI